MNDQDTIVAISTPVGYGGIGIVRVSGEQALACSERVFRPKRRRSKASSHTVTYGHVVDFETGDVVDQALLIVMRAPRSYTAEDVVEISCHGGPVPLSQTLNLLLRAGARLASPGEFTKRAFLNGRIDLAQAEAVCDMIQAKTDASARLASQQMEGRLSGKVRSIREELLSLLASIEAGIDFPEHDVEELTRSELDGGLRSVRSEISHLLQSAVAGRVFREGVRVSIVGRPNVGKSSLLNALLGHERAIVTAVPGTTRDLIEETASIRGIPFVLTDTAGIRDTEDAVERIGVERAQLALGNADLTIAVFDATMELTSDDFEVIQRAHKKPTIVVLNKIDAASQVTARLELSEAFGGQDVLEVSALRGTGMDAVIDALFTMATGDRRIDVESATVTNIRHQECLSRAKRHVEEALVALSEEVPYDLTSIDIRSAVDALGLITGETAEEDLLDTIFRRFCIGK